MITLIIINQLINIVLLPSTKSAKFVVSTVFTTFTLPNIIFMYIGVDFIFWRSQRRDPIRDGRHETSARIIAKDVESAAVQSC